MFSSKYSLENASVHPSIHDKSSTSAEETQSGWKEGFELMWMLVSGLQACDMANTPKNGGNSKTGGNTQKLSISMGKTIRNPWISGVSCRLSTFACASNPKFPGFMASKGESGFQPESHEANHPR